MAAELLSDVEREQALARLRAGCAEGRFDLDEFGDRVALVLAARTDTDLTPVLADLPVPVEPPPPPKPRPVERVVSVLGGTHQGGRWRPARPTRAVAVLGSCQLDLCEVDLDEDVEIRAVAVLGGIEVLLPEGVAAELGGLSVLGSKDYRVRRSLCRPGGPVVRVRATAVFGGVTVRTRPFSRASGQGPRGPRD
jgi:hypothetical protein